MRAALQPASFQGASRGCPKVTPKSRQGDEPESRPVAPDMSGTEVPADHQRRRVGKALEQLVAACDGLLRVGIRGRGPVEMGHLAGMVGNVAGEQGFLAV